MLIVSRWTHAKDKTTAHQASVVSSDLPNLILHRWLGLCGMDVAKLFAKLTTCYCLFIEFRRQQTNVNSDNIILTSGWCTACPHSCHCCLQPDSRQPLPALRHLYLWPSSSSHSLSIGHAFSVSVLLPLVYVRAF